MLKKAWNEISQKIGLWSAYLIKEKGVNLHVVLLKFCGH